MIYGNDVENRWYHILGVYAIAILLILAFLAPFLK
jgi:hypothetical protein